MQQLTCGTSLGTSTPHVCLLLCAGCTGLLRGWRLAPGQAWGQAVLADCASSVAWRQPGRAQHALSILLATTCRGRGKPSVLAASAKCCT